MRISCMDDSSTGVATPTPFDGSRRCSSGLDPPDITASSALVDSDKTDKASCVASFTVDEDDVNVAIIFGSSVELSRAELSILLVCLSCSSSVLSGISSPVSSVVTGPSSSFIKDGMSTGGACDFDAVVFLFMTNSSSSCNVAGA